MKNYFPKTLLVLSVSFLCTSVLFFVFLYKTIDAKNIESQLKESEWHTEALRRDGIKSLDRGVKAIEKERTELETHFAKSSDIVPFLDTIEELAPLVKVKAEITSVEILPSSPVLVVGMKASGTFDGLYRFLTLLENSPYELEFVELQMHKESGVAEANKDSQSLKWNTIFKIKLLSFVIQ